MPTITFRQLFGGIIKDYTGGNAASVEGRENQYARSDGVDLYRQGFVGHMSPAQLFTTGSISNAAINSLPRAVAVDVRGTPNVFYMLGGLSGTAPKVVLTQNDAYVSSQSITPHGHNFTTLPTGTGFWGEDVIVYKAKVGGTAKTCLFYSWNDDQDGDIGRYDIDAATYDDDFMSTVPSGAVALTANVPHKFVEGPDKILYATNGQYVSSYDGATGSNGTLNRTAYDLGLGWIATDITFKGNNIVIAAVKAGSFNYYTYSSQSKVCFWDGVEPGLGIVYDIPDNFISAIYPTVNGILLFTQGRNATAKIMDLNGRILSEWNTGLYGTPPKSNQIELYQDNFVWSPGDNLSDFIMAHSPDNQGLHVPMLASDGTNLATTTGFLKNINGNNLYLGGLFAGTYKIVYLNGFASYASEVNLRTRVVRLPFKSNITKIRAYFSQMASGSSAQFSLFKNYKTMTIASADDLLNKTIGFSTLSAAIDEREILNGKAIPNVSAFYMNFKLTGQISIAMVEVEYERVEKNS